MKNNDILEIEKKWVSIARNTRAAQFFSEFSAEDFKDAFWNFLLLKNGDSAALFIVTEKGEKYFNIFEPLAIFRKEFSKKEYKIEKLDEFYFEKDFKNELLKIFNKDEIFSIMKNADFSLKEIKNFFDYDKHMCNSRKANVSFLKKLDDFRNLLFYNFESKTFFNQAKSLGFGETKIYKLRAFLKRSKKNNNYKKEESDDIDVNSDLVFENYKERRI